MARRPLGNARHSLLVASVVLGALLAAAPTMSSAQKYPSQDIHVICAFPPGSGADIMVRYIGEKLREKSVVTVLVENKVGAAGNIAAEYTARAKPDGYTIHIHAGSAIAANYWLFKKPPIDPVKDLQIAATINIQPFMVMVTANSPYKSLHELTDAMKAKGDKASYGESNTVGKVMGELYKVATGVKAVDVPYRTAADMLNDFASGVIDYGMIDPQSANAHSQSGRLRILAVSTGKRIQSLPDFPTMKEEGANVELFGWFAAIVPSATPRPIVDQLNKWFGEIIATDETRKFLAQFGDPWITTPEEGQAQLVKDKAAWEGYVKAAKIDPQ
jgi:tripartite-type tricarboxylate transporter receptor subunit TctC